MANYRADRKLILSFVLCLALFLGQPAYAFNLNNFLDQANIALDKVGGIVQKTFGGPVATPTTVPQTQTQPATSSGGVAGSPIQSASDGSWWDKVFGGVENSSEKAMGAQGHEALRKKPGFYNNAADLARVGALARPLVKVVDRKDLTYRFTILDTDEVNAFALPGGYVYVTRGLLRSVQNNDELAAVMAHELAHINKKHGVRQAEKAGMMAVLVAAMGLNDEAKKYQKAAAIAAFFSSMKFSRDDEYEADKIAVQYAQKAGFNPYGMSAFLERINKDSGITKVTKYFSTHPPTTERINRANAEAQKVSGRAPSTSNNAPTANEPVVSTPTQQPKPQPKPVPQGITLQEAYQDYLYTKSIYEQKVSKAAPYDEIMSAFNDYQRAKEIYFQLKAKAGQ